MTAAVARQEYYEYLEKAPALKIHSHGRFSIKAMVWSPMGLERVVGGVPYGTDNEFFGIVQLDLLRIEFRNSWTESLKRSNTTDSNALTIFSLRCSPRVERLIEKIILIFKGHWSLLPSVRSNYKPIEEIV